MDGFSSSFNTILSRVYAGDGLAVGLFLPLQPYKFITEFVYPFYYFFLLHGQNNVGSTS